MYTLPAPTSDPATEQSQRIFPSDLKIFKGTKATVNESDTPAQILESIRCNFEVVRAESTFIPERADGSLYHNQDGTPVCLGDDNIFNWYRTDNWRKLGTHGPKRIPTQPGKFIELFQKFCLASEKQVNLDIVGTFDSGQSFYMVSKLTDGNFDQLCSDYSGEEFNIKNLVSAEDRTVHYLMISDYYKEQKAPQVHLFSQELVCSNTMSKRIESKIIKLAHDKPLEYKDVSPVLTSAIREITAYNQMKDRFIHAEISMDTASKALNDFLQSLATSVISEKKIERLNKILDPSNGLLIGKELDERQGNVWGLFSVMTQDHSHNYVGRDEAGGRTLRSQVDGTRARLNNQFRDYLDRRFCSEESKTLVSV